MQVKVIPAEKAKSFEVLVVDDDPDVREMLCEFFRSRSIPVASAADGRAAISELERAPATFGMVLTDLILPGADGLEVLACARQVNPSIAVVIITGYASIDSAVQAVRLGAYDYLTKPFSLGQLDALLKRVLERSALETENRHLTRLVGARVAPAPEERSRLDALEDRVRRLESFMIGGRNDRAV